MTEEELEESPLSLNHLEYLIEEKYPFPISYSYKLLKREKDKMITYLINCFDVTLRYICYILIADAFTRHRMREEIKKCLEKLQLLDLGRKGAGFIISQIHRLIPPENQFIPCLTSKFESLRENYMSLYNLRCNQKHDTLLQKRSLNERMSEEEKECYLDILRSFLKRLKILSLYSLIIIKGPVSYDKHSRSMKYKVVECMGDDRDFSGPCYLDIPRDELVPNNYVAIVKSMSPYEADNFTPGNLLPLYPLIIALPDKRTQRENMLLYHHFENKDKTFCFIDCDEGERKIGPTCEDKFLNQLYNELYQIIFFSRSQGD